MLYFLPLCQIFCKWCWQLFSKVFTWSQNGSTKLHKRSKDVHGDSFGFRQFFLSEFQRASVPTQPLGNSSWNICSEVMFRTSSSSSSVFCFCFLVVLFLPQLRCSPNSFRVPKTGWARTPHENSVHKKKKKTRRQKINQHRLQIYNLQRSRVYQISCWNIYGQQGLENSRQYLELLGRCGNHYGFFPLLQENCRSRPIIGQ